MLVVDNFHVKIRYTYTHFFSNIFLKVVLISCYSHMFFKSSIGFWLSNCFKRQKSTIGMHNTQYSIGLSVHKQPSVFNIHDITYTIQCRVNCLID